MDNIVSAADLFGRYQLVKKSGRVVDTRSALVGWFAEQVGKPPHIIGIRLAHMATDQLYGLQSAYSDRLNRNSRETADKFFWWATRTKLSTGGV